MFARWREKYGKITARLLWDLFMVWVALINLGLIAFDLTYPWLRPYYFHYVPVVTRVYDPVLGIEPHPLTEQFVEDLDAARSLADLAPGSPELAERLSTLERLTARILTENPFDRSGLGQNLELFKQEIAHESGRPVAALNHQDTMLAAVHDLWTGSSAEIRARLDRFDVVARDLLTENYFREYDPSGRLVDHFWVLDLPFLLLFWVEFCIRWFVAVRRHTFARWFFFPIFNWYDVLGLVPVGYLRVFRLLRLVSVYLRLRRSELSHVGKDFVSRTVAYISNIVTEEVSDRVAIRILDEFSEEIRNGTHRRIIQETVGDRRSEVEQVLSDQIRELVADEEVLASVREVLRLNLGNAVESSDALRAVPLPKAVMAPVIRVVGEVILDTTLETVRATLETDDGRQAVDLLAATVIDRLFGGPALEETERLVREISLEVIDHMKATVAVKKWAQPDAQRLPHSLAEAMDDIAATE